MLRLTLEGHEVDLYEDVSVNLTLQFTDVQNVNNPAGSFSQTFRVPATANNLDYFGPITDSTAVDIVNLKQRIPAQILSDSLPILSGFCQVKAIYLQKEKYADIELVFFGGAVDLKSAVGDGELTDLDLSALDHEVNKTNIQNSWLATSTSPAPYVRWGVIDRGNNWSASNPPWGVGSKPAIYQNELTPFVSVYKILDAIMDEAGFTWESTFFGDPDSTASTTRAMYVPAHNGSLNVAIAGGTADNTMKANLDGDEIHTGSGGSTALIPFEDDHVDGYDPEDNWDNNTYRYTAPSSGLYSVRLRIVGTLGVAGAIVGPHIVRIRVRIYRGATPAIDEIREVLELSYTNDDSTTFDFDETIELSGTGASPSIPLLTGEYFEVQYNLAEYALLSGGGAGEPRCSVEVFEASPPFSLFDVDIAGSLPKMKQIDFLLGLQRMFNLVFVPDKNKPSHVLIEPFTDYVETGTQKDWTDKVDYSKDVTLKPTTDLQKKVQEWTYKPGLDFISKSVQDSLGRVYGRFEVTEPNNDFAKGEQKIETTFGQFLPSLIPGVGGPIHRSLQADGQGIEEPLPMVAYWTGVQDTFIRWWLRNDDGLSPDFFALTDFPMFSNYSADEPTVSSYDLNFGMEAPFFPIPVNPANTLYFEYWAQYVTELYSDEARLMTCTMRLDKRELADFEFSDNIFIKDSYFRVLKISYDSNVEGTCTVELIKILSDIAVCQDTPTGISERYNVILFNDSTDVSPDYGSPECCRLYGYDTQTIPNGYPGGTSPMTVCVPRRQATPPETT